MAAAFAANVVADMEVETLLRVPNGWHSSASEVLRGAIALNCDQIIMQAMEQKTQQGKEEIAFNVQVNKEQEQEKQERERCKEAEKAELKRRQAEWRARRAEEKRRLKSAKFAELLTVDEALSFLWHNVGRDVLLVALNKLGGIGEACPFEMVIAVLHKAMQQDSMGCSTGPGQRPTAAADMCTAVNTADVLIVHTAAASGTGAWQWHSGDGGKTDIDSTHLGRTAVHAAANGVKNKWTFNASKVLQKIRQLFRECAGEGVLMKFTLEIVF